MGPIFISYRRQDAPGTTGRLADGLKAAFGTKPVFQDVRSIAPGQDFVDAIDEALASTAVLLAVIGPRWLPAADDMGRRRLDLADDFVRREIVTALKRGILVIPVIVEGAKMPAEEFLPEELKPLARRQAHELSDKRWDYDLGLLVDRLAQAMGVPSPAMPHARPRSLGLASRTIHGFAPTGSLLLHAAALATIVFQVVAALGPRDGLTEDVRSELYNFASDGGSLLVTLAAVTAVSALVANHLAELPGAVGRWLRNPRIAIVLVAYLLVSIPLIATQKHASTLVAMVLFFVYMAVKTRFPDSRPTGPQIATGVGVAAAALGGALALDLYLGRTRAASFDIAFVLPPEPARTEHAQAIFEEARSALKRAFQGVDTFRVAPDHLAPDEFERFQVDDPKPLLTYKTDDGYAAIFIRSRYTVFSRGPDAVSQVRILVTPYRRDPASKTPVTIGSWPPFWIDVRVNDKHDVYRAALHASFELAAFLGRQKLIRLSSETQQRVWRNVLREYVELLPLVAPDCREAAEIEELLKSEAALQETDVRQALVACSKDWKSRAMAESDRDVATARAALAPAVPK